MMGGGGNYNVNRTGREMMKDNDRYDDMDFTTGLREFKPPKRESDWRSIFAYGAVAAGITLVLFIVYESWKLFHCWGDNFYTNNCQTLSDREPYFVGAIIAAFVIIPSWSFVAQQAAKIKQEHAIANRINLVLNRFGDQVPADLFNGMSLHRLMDFLQNQYTEAGNLQREIAPYQKYKSVNVLTERVVHYNNTSNAALPGPDDTLGMPIVVPFDTWVSWLTELVHLLLIGKTGTGKSTLGDIILSLRAALGHMIAILDPHWSTEDKYGNKKWGGITPLAKTLDEVPVVLAALKNEYNDRFRRMQLPADDPEFTPEGAFDPITVLIDEVPEIIQHLGPHSALWKSTVQIFGSGGRKVNIYAIMLSQSPNVEDVGMNAKMRDNFSTIALANMARPFIETFKMDRTLKAQLYTLLMNSSKGIIDMFKLPAAAEREGAVSILSREGILGYRQKEIDAQVWTPRAPDSDSEKEAKKTLLEALLGIPESNGIPHQDAGIDQRISELYSDLPEARIVDIEQRLRAEGFKLSAGYVGRLKNKLGLGYRTNEQEE